MIWIVSLGAIAWVYYIYTLMRQAESSNIADDMDKEMDYLNAQMDSPPIEGLKNVKRKPQHFIPSKDIDHIMSGKHIDPFD